MYKYDMKSQRLLQILWKTSSFNTAQKQKYWSNVILSFFSFWISDQFDILLFLALRRGFQMPNFSLIIGFNCRVLNGNQSIEALVKKVLIRSRWGDGGLKSINDPVFRVKGGKIFENQPSFWRKSGISTCFFGAQGSTFY